MVKAKSKSSSPTELKSSVLERICDGINTRKYKAGARLNETSLAREFNVSRIQVREALMRLEERGLVVSQPRRGMFVTTLTELETQQINSVRLVLEAEALKLCRAQISAEMMRELNSLVTAMEEWQSGSQLEAAELDSSFTAPFGTTVETATSKRLLAPFLHPVCAPGAGWNQRRSSALDTRPSPPAPQCDRRHLVRFTGRGHRSPPPCRLQRPGAVFEPGARKRCSCRFRMRMRALTPPSKCASKASRLL